MNLRGKVVLVTGASKGIGKAIAIELASLGASVAINYASDDKGAEDTLNKVNAIGGYGKTFKMDISKFENCRSLINEVLNAFGKIDILVNNAGKANINLLLDMNEESINQIINTNLMGAIYLSKFAVEHMINGGGNIINISSMWGEVGASCEAVYSAAKGGINAFTKALAKETAPFGIRVNAVAPGVINTEMNSILDEEEKNTLVEEIPMMRFGEPEEVAKVVSFLCDEKSRYLTGQIIRIDGGMI